MTYSATVLADSPLAYWRLGESSGSAADSSGNGHTVTFSGTGLTRAVTGLLGGGDTDKALGGGGSGGGATGLGTSSSQLAAAGTFAHFTFECIVKLTANASITQIPFQILDSDGNFIGFQTSGANGIFLQWDGTSSFYNSSTLSFTSGSIYHLAVTYDGTNFVFYVDGAVFSTAAVSDAGLKFTQPPFAFIGNNGNPINGPNYQVDGTVDECAFYNTALTSTRIAAHATAAVLPPAVVTARAWTPSSHFGPVGVVAPVVVSPWTVETTLPSIAVGVPTLPNENTANIGVPGSDPTNPVYTIKVTSMLGVVAKTLTLAEPDDVTWTLDEPDEATFHFGKGAYAPTDVNVFSEIQLYRNGNLLTWGPITAVSVSGSDGSVKMTVNGVDWYLNRRFLDGVITNAMSNPDFESSTANWSAEGGVTFTVDSTTFETGANSAKLVGTVTNADAFITQSAVMGPNQIGLEVVASAWFYIDTFVGAAIGPDRGLYIEGIAAGDVFVENNYYAIDEATPRAQWVKASTNLWIPPNTTWTINLRLYGINGTIRWDDVKLVTMQSVDASIHDPVTLVQEAADISHVIREMVVHVQDPSVGKSDVHVKCNAEVTGTPIIKVYQWVDHVQFDEAMQELLERDDGVDYTMDLTPTSRTFHSFANKRGTDRSGTLTLKYVAGDATSNCADYRTTRDGGTTITRQTVLGSDNGPDREQGEASDTSHVPNGLILQDVRQASQDATVDSLQPTAAERIARYAVSPDTIDFDLKGAAGWVGILMPGDLVTINLQDGFMQGSGTRRVMAVKLNCPTNILTVTVAQDSLS